MDDNLKSVVNGFLEFLKANDLYQFLPQIVEVLKRKAQEEESRGVVVSAIPLENKEIKEIEKFLTEKLGRKIVVTNEIDKSIIGGLIIKYQDLVIDQSVTARLKELKDEIYGH